MCGRCKTLQTDCCSATGHFMWQRVHIIIIKLTDTLRQIGEKQHLFSKPLKSAQFNSKKRAVSCTIIFIFHGLDCFFFSCSNVSAVRNWTIKLVTCYLYRPLALICGTAPDDVTHPEEPQLNMWNISLREDPITVMTRLQQRKEAETWIPPDQLWFCWVCLSYECRTSPFPAGRLEVNAGLL